MHRGHQTQQNYVKQLYDQFTDDEISAKISEIVRPADMKAEVEVVFQTVDNLHKAIPHHTAIGILPEIIPTPGGMKVVNRSYVNYMEGKLCAGLTKSYSASVISGVPKPV